MSSGCPLDFAENCPEIENVLWIIPMKSTIYAPLGKFMRSNGHDFVQSETDSLKIKALANQSNGHFAKNCSSGLEIACAARGEFPRSHSAATLTT